MGEQTLDDLLDAIGAKQPAPGGGAVASMLVAIATALTEMVVRYSTGKKKLAAHDTLYNDALDALARIRSEAMQLAEDDVAAYKQLNSLQRLDHDDPQRREEWAGAVDAAIAVPRRCMNRSLDLLRLCDSLVGKSNEWLRSDLAIAAVVAEAGVAGAAWNVRINAPLLGNEAARRKLDTELRNATNLARALRTNIESACH